MKDRMQVWEINTHTAEAHVPPNADYDTLLKAVQQEFPDVVDVAFVLAEPDRLDFTPHAGDYILHIIGVDGQDQCVVVPSEHYWEGNGVLRPSSEL